MINLLTTLYTAVHLTKDSVLWVMQALAARVKRCVLELQQPLYKVQIWLPTTTVVESRQSAIACYSKGAAALHPQLLRSGRAFRVRQFCNSEIEPA